jgi:hypothetical protein
MAWVTTRREGEKSYRSDVHRIFKIVDAGMYSLKFGQIGIQDICSFLRRNECSVTAMDQILQGRMIFVTKRYYRS